MGLYMVSMVILIYVYLVTRKRKLIDLNMSYWIEAQQGQGGQDVIRYLNNCDLSLLRMQVYTWLIKRLRRLCVRHINCSDWLLYFRSFAEATCDFLFLGPFFCNDRLSPAVRPLQLKRADSNCFDEEGINTPETFTGWLALCKLTLCTGP